MSSLTREQLERFEAMLARKPETPARLELAEIARLAKLGLAAEGADSGEAVASADEWEPIFAAIDALPAGELTHFIRRFRRRYGLVGR